MPGNISMPAFTPSVVPPPPVCRGQQTADELEALLFRRHHADALIVAVTREQKIEPIALLALDEKGRVRGLTTALLRILSFHQRDTLMGQPVSELLGVGLDALLASRPDSPLPLGLCHWQAWQLAPVTTSTPSVKTSRAADPLEQAAGEDPGLLHQATVCRRMVDRGISILIQGETGTGKEVWARALHNSSARHDKAFITLNCAAIPESLIESELFGYGAGSFTGALKGGKQGKIAASSGGTLFLDEIGDMPLALQTRLLRVLAEQEVTPVGELRAVPVELNVICATHRELTGLVAEGRFREDLYYRISSLKVALPPLRERQDRRILIRLLLAELANGTVPSFDAEVEQRLLGYAWPGNIRQLKSVLQYALAMTDEGIIRPEHLPDEVLGDDSKPLREDKMRPSLTVVREQQERQLLLETLEHYQWTITRAAAALGVSRATLHRKINRYGLVSPNKGCR
ncbi:sigma-54-dependent Fis family transcriptional regulator [Oceanimonas baumannii]|nr:sigma 54-interacting transcriptional regulator [Oceanimonas baumannii]